MTPREVHRLDTPAQPPPVDGATDCAFVALQRAMATPEELRKALLGLSK